MSKTPPKSLRQTLHDFWKDCNEDHEPISAFGQQCIVQMDKAPAQNAKFTRAAIANMGLELLDWPGNSPDLNPIEGVWSLLKERINKLRPKPYTRKQIEKTIQKEWNSLKPMNCYEVCRD